MLLIVYFAIAARWFLPPLVHDHLSVSGHISSSSQSDQVDIVVSSEDMIHCPFETSQNDGADISAPQSDDYIGVSSEDTRCPFESRNDDGSQGDDSCRRAF